MPIELVIWSGKRTKRQQGCIATFHTSTHTNLVVVGERATSEWMTHKLKQTTLDTRTVTLIPNLNYSDCRYFHSILRKRWWNNSCGNNCKAYASFTYCKSSTWRHTKYNFVLVAPTPNPKQVNNLFCCYLISFIMITYQFRGLTFLIRNTRNISFLCNFKTTS